jgi:branched-chain amino acid transport system substrate-binding protein
MNKYLKVVLILCVMGIGATLLFRSVSNNNENIKIGGISALSGVGASVGEDERKGAVLAVEEVNKRGGINGRTIELISEDLSIDKINKAVSVAEKLINIDKVVAIVGAQWDETTFPILPIAEKAEVSMVGADNSDQLEKDKDYPYFFSTWYDNRVGVREILRYSGTHNIKRISIIKFLAAGFWEFTARTMTDEASKYDVEVVNESDLGNPTALDFRTELLKVNQYNPDAIFIVTNDFNQCSFLKQKAELGINTIALGTESSADGTSITNCPDLMEDRVWSAPKGGNKYYEFESRFTARFGQKPNSPSAATAYDAVMVIASALQKTNGRGGEELQNAIQATNIDGVSVDKIVFNQKGFLVTPEDTFSMKGFKDGEAVDLK